LTLKGELNIPCICSWSGYEDSLVYVYVFM